MDETLTPGPGDWVNYVKAAAQAVEGRWRLERGIDAAVVSDLPPAAGLSSSSALLSGFALALLRPTGSRPLSKNSWKSSPTGEQFVGTRGGSHGPCGGAALEGRMRSLIHFAPLSVAPRRYRKAGLSWSHTA